MENNFLNFLFLVLIVHLIYYLFFASTQIQNVESTYKTGNLNEMTSNLKSVIFPKTQTFNR